MTLRPFVLFLVLFACLAAYPAKGESPMDDIFGRLVPKPREVTQGEGQFGTTKTLTIVIEPKNKEDRFAAELLASALNEEWKAAAEIVETADLAESETKGRILMGDPCRNWPLAKAMRARDVTIPAEAASQGYVLDVAPDRILIAANSPAGTYYGVQTLIQLLQGFGEGELPCVRINDWPGVRERGVSIDLYAGEVYQPRMFKETIRRMGHYKLNMLVLYLEDAFLFPSHPDIGEDRDRLTTEETLELDAFARQHHVELVPCYNSPAHMGNTLKHPNYAYLSEGAVTKQSVINVTHPDTYPLLCDLYRDLCKAFPSRYHYVSSDEVFGLAMDKSAAAAKEVGRDNLFLRHQKIIYDVLKENGKRMALSGDPFEPGMFDKGFLALGYFGPDTLRRLPRDIIIGPWHYGKVTSYAFGDQLKEMGFDQFLVTSNQSFIRLFPAQNSAAANVESFTPYAHRLNALGVIHTDWNIPGKNTFYEYNWPGQIIFAEWAWTDSGRPWEEILPACVESFYGPGTAPLAETIRLMGDCGSYFGVPVFGREPPDFALFFKEMVPDELNAKREKDLTEFREAWEKAKESFDRARPAVTRNRDHLDFLEFALDQQEALADLVECRHLMSQPEAKSQARYVDLLRDLGKRLPALRERYTDLWHRVDRPLGLDPNRRRFDEVCDSIQAAIAMLPGE